MSGYLARIGGDVRRDAPEPTRGFAEALAAGPSLTVVAEIKRSSPSQGAIAPDADIAATAARYETGGAACMSVLCAERDFGGSLDHLRRGPRGGLDPGHRQGLHGFPEQVAAQRLAGADAILVILAMVSDDEARRLMETAALLGMDALVETHSREEIDRAVAIGARVVGVNARDLETLEVDRERQLELLSVAAARRGAALPSRASRRDARRAGPRRRCRRGAGGDGADARARAAGRAGGGAAWLRRWSRSAG